MQRQDEERITAQRFIDAAICGELEVVQLYIAQNQRDILEINNHRDCWGEETALMKAAKYGHTVVIEALIAAGAEIDAARPYDGETALMLAAKNGETAAVKILIDSGANVNTRNKNNCKTALMDAAYAGYIDTVQVLLTAGADVNAADENDRTALFYAVDENLTLLPRVLLATPHINLNAYDQGLRSAIKARYHNLEIENLINNIINNELNGTQKNIIQSIMSFILDAVSDLLPQDAIYALEAMLKKPETIAIADIAKFKSQNIWECIQQVHNIFSHPCPENRSESYPYVGQEDGFCMARIDRETVSREVELTGDLILKNGRVILKSHVVRNRLDCDYLIIKEQTGLLGLTKLDDNKSPPITKNRVVVYISQLITENIKKEEQRNIQWNHAATVIQKGYRQRLQRKVLAPFNPPPSKDFSLIIRNGEIYVDKTEMIVKLSEDFAFVKVIKRPKSSGKSLTLSMLQHFFSPIVDGKETAHLFDGLKIAGHPHQGKYSVILLDFSHFDITAFKSFNDFFKSFCSTITKLYQKYAYLMEVDNFSILDKKDFNLLINLDSLSDDKRLEKKFTILHSVLRLAMLIKKDNTHKGISYNECKPIILIDTCPIPKDILSPLQKEIQKFFECFFLVIMKRTDDNIESAIVMCEVNDGNTFPYHSCYYANSDKYYNTYFGFTLEEVNALLKKYQLDIVTDSLFRIEEKNYFSVGGAVLYSPVAVLAYIDSKLNPPPDKLTVLLGNPWDKITCSSTSSEPLPAESSINQLRL